jgi:transposase-like protein
MFEPPRCPFRNCDFHKGPRASGRSPRFYQRAGVFHAQRHSRPVPRFRCKRCRRTFSRQTFRMDCWDKRPHLNGEAFSRFCSGGGIRQTARELRIRPNNLAAKLSKIARHLGHLNHTLMGRFDASEHRCEFALDEQETFELCRRTRPLTVAFLIHQETNFVVGAEVGTLPPRGKRKPADVRRIERLAAVEGRRRSTSRAVCAAVLERAARHCGPDARIALRSDMKRTYPGLARAAFGDRLEQHRQIHSRRRRDPSNPLHRINLTLAVSRDLMGRLRRRSWLATKRREWLDLHLQLFIAYRNWHRPRFNKDDESPAQMLGFLPRRLTRGELLGWRQDWGPERSIPPGHDQAAVAATPAA